LLTTLAGPLELLARLLTRVPAALLLAALAPDAGSAVRHSMD
jgi:hypothetical protein